MYKEIKRVKKDYYIKIIIYKKNPTEANEKKYKI